jgi:2-polyprenyl-3-methyl-5-hydroxy-6-metoxy-1,4-benzoquinol methylase
MAGEFDQVRSEAFASRMVGILNDAALALMTSIGQQVGLFDAMAKLPAATSEKIAAAAGLDERYVREWLGAMATGRIVTYRPDDGTYSLPSEHAAWLTSAAGTSNLALQTQYIPLLAQVEERIIECFRKGGGVPYSAYPRFQRLMAADSGAVHDASLVDTILPLAQGLVARLRAGIDVADIGCGSGHAVNLMARAFPQSRFSGFDISEEGIVAGRAEAHAMGLSNARFEALDVTRWGARGEYDFVTAFDAIHDQARPADVLRRVAEALRPEGLFLMVDIAASSNVGENLDHALGPFMYTVSCMHCMTVSLAPRIAGRRGANRRRVRHCGGGLSTQRSQGRGDLNNYYIATK